MCEIPTASSNTKRDNFADTGLAAGTPAGFASTKECFKRSRWFGKRHKTDTFTKLGESLPLCCCLFTWREGGGGGRCSETGREGEAEVEFVCIDLLVILLCNSHQRNILIFFLKDRIRNVANKVKLVHDYNTYRLLADWSG